MQEPGRRALSLAVWDRLRGASLPMRARLDRRLEGDAPTPAQMGVLRALLSEEEDATTPRELATCLHVTPGTVSSTLNGLEDAGLIVRQRKSGDRRVVNLRVTAKGREKVARWRAIFLEELEDYLSGLTAAELRTLLAILTKIHGPSQRGPVRGRGVRARPPDHPAPSS